MAVRLVCRACGKRLKLPDDVQPKRSAKCPKCLAAIDLTAALESAVYKPTVAMPELAAVKPTGGSPTPPAETQPKPARIGEDDPLPYDPAPKPNEKAEPAKPQAASPRGKSILDSEGDLLPYPTTPAARSTPPPIPPAARAKPQPPNEEPLSLDDDPVPVEAPPELAPFRVPVRVLADSLRQAVGPCFAVIVPHGVFLEHEPRKPFLYFPVGCAVDSPASGELTALLPDRRAVTIRFAGRAGRALARDTRAFLAGERPPPVPADYRLRWWLLLPALIFALGLASGPLVLSQTAELGLEFGLQVGAGFALLGLVANAAVVVFSRRAVFVQMLMMAGMCLLVTGIFFFGATAYLAGRQKAAEEVKVEPPPQPPPTPPPQPPPDPKPPEPPPVRAPSHLDRAKKNGSSALEDGPADVTALTLAPDRNTLGIGHADGTTRIWPLDQPTFDAMQPGPKADGPVLRLQFDSKTLFVFAHTATGVVAAPRSGPPAVMAKIPGPPVAIAPQLADDRVRFAACRGNLIQHRLLAAEFVRNPPVKGKVGAYALPNAKTDEIVPKDSGRDPGKPPAVTFLAWTPDGRLFLGQPNGTISIWDSTMRALAPSYDHKAAVKVFADCPDSSFATGDEKGNVALWPQKGGKPTVWPVFDGAPVTGLSFNAAGTRLAITDNTGWLVIWDAKEGKAIHRVKRPSQVKGMTFGPNDDVMILSAGKTVEVWWLPELIK